MSNDVPQPRRFGDPVTPFDVVKDITTLPVFGREGTPEDATYYYGRFKALYSAFKIAGELMDRDARETLESRLTECHALATQANVPQDRHVVEAGNFFLLLAADILLQLKTDPPPEAN